MNLIKCNPTRYIWVQIKYGETLQDIASRYKVSISKIVRNNNNIELYEGEMVKVLIEKSNYHIVKPMETLDNISAIYDVSVDDLIRFNNLTSKRVVIGQQLKICK